MGIRRKGPGGGDSRDPADTVLRNCEKLDWVACSAVTYEEGLALGFFLQFHDDNGQGLPTFGALARAAFRNYTPVSAILQRAVTTTAGEVHPHDEGEKFTIPANRGKYYRPGTLTDVVLVSPPKQGRFDVTATVKVKAAGVSLTKPSEDLIMTWPPRGPESRCACCLRSYRM